MAALHEPTYVILGRTETVQGQVRCDDRRTEQGHAAALAKAVPLEQAARIVPPGCDRHPREPCREPTPPPATPLRAALGRLSARVLR